MSACRQRHISDKRNSLLLRTRNSRKLARPRKRSRVRIERKLIDRTRAPAPHIDEIRLRSHRKPQPGIWQPRAANLFLARKIDHADRRRIIAAIEHQQILAVVGNGLAHRKRIHRNLLPGRPQDPSAIEQEPSIRQRPYLLMRIVRIRRVLRGKQNTNSKEIDKKFHSVNLCAIGKRRPTPNAFGVIRNPGAACCRLYSLRSTFRTISRTSSSEAPVSAAISRTVLYSSTYFCRIASSRSYSGKLSVSFWSGRNSAEGGFVSVFSGIGAGNPRFWNRQFASRASRYTIVFGTSLITASPPHISPYNVQ